MEHATRRELRALLLTACFAPARGDGFAHGVNLGGWLVIEPSMFDQGTMGPCATGRSRTIAARRTAQRCPARPCAFECVGTPARSSTW